MADPAVYDIPQTNSTYIQCDDGTVMDPPADFNHRAPVYTPTAVTQATNLGKTLTVPS